MGIIQLLVILCIIGVALFLINKYAPIDGKIKTIINWVVIIVVVIWIVRILFASTGFHDVKI